MPKITYTLKLEKNWSLIVTDSFLREMSKVALAAGWNFDGCTFSTKDSGDVNCPTLDDIAEVPAYILGTIRTASLTYQRAGAEFGEYAFIKLGNNYPLFGYKAFSMNINTSDNGAALKLQSSLNSFLHTKKQWYSWLSMTFLYWPLVCVPALIGMVTGGIQMMVRRPVSTPNFVTLTGIALDLIGVAMMLFRLRLFPANDFNLTDPPASQTKAGQLRSFAGRGLKWAGGIIAAGLFGWLIKHKLG